MLNDATIDVIYGYSRYACRNTPFDYRDVAHNAILRFLTRYESGKIKHIKTYVYLVIKSTIVSMLRNKHVLLFQPEMLECVEAQDANNVINSKMDMDKIRSKLKKKESAIVNKTIQGYTRKEIGKQMGMTISGVNVTWYRMVRRLRIKNGIA